MCRDKEADFSLPGGKKVIPTTWAGLLEKAVADLRIQCLVILIKNDISQCLSHFVIIPLFSDYLMLPLIDCRFHEFRNYIFSPSFPWHV